MNAKEVSQANQAVEELGGQIINGKVVFEDASFPLKDLIKGMRHEAEHDESLGGPDQVRSAKIAIDHLRERRDYYNAMSFIEFVPKGAFEPIYLVLIIAIILILIFLFAFSSESKKMNTAGTL